MPTTYDGDLLDQPDQLGFFPARMERFGVTGKARWRAKLLKGLVGAWGFEPQTPTVSR